MKLIKLDKRRIFNQLERQIAWDSNLKKNKGHVLCELCGNEIHSFSDYHLDHFLAHTKGGKTTLVNAQVSHKKCNLRKGKKTK